VFNGPLGGGTPDTVAATTLTTSTSSSSTTANTGVTITNSNFTADTRAGVLLRNGDAYSAAIWSPRGSGADGTLVFGTNDGGGIAESNITEKLRIDSSGTITLPGSATITGLPTPTLDSDAANKSFVDASVAAVASGVNPLPATRLATAAVLPNSPTYSNGASGVGATLTAGSNTTLTVDGTVAALNDIVLVKTQASAFQNGQYYVSQVGSGAAPWILTRCTLAACGKKYDTAATITLGSYSYITAGSANTSTSWIQSSTVATVGADAVNYVLFTGQVVTAFNSRSGAITPQTGDYAVAQVTGAAALAGPTFTGDPKAPTPTVGDNDTSIATTAFVQAAVGVRNVSTFGVTCDGSTDDTTALASIKTYLDTEDGLGHVLPTINFTGGTCLFTAWPNLVYNNFIITSSKPTYLQYSGTGDCVKFDATAKSGVNKMTIGPFSIRCPSGALNGFTATRIYRSTIQDITVLGAGTGSIGMVFKGCILCYIVNPTVSVNIVGTWYSSGKPDLGIVFDKETTGGTFNSTSNTVINPIVEGINSIGIYLQNAVSNTLIGGSSEGNPTGIVFETTSSRNKVDNMDFESNSTRDVSMSGHGNWLVDVQSEKETLLNSTGGGIRGGTFSQITVGVSGLHARVQDAEFNQFNDGSTFSNSGTGTICTSNTNIGASTVSSSC
jgi:hypothetical protein